MSVTVSMDEIWPVHPSDGLSGLRNVLFWSARFDDQLEAGKLASSLAKLCSHGGWRKLGGRLHLNTRRVLELHIPKIFTAARPAIGFDHVRHDRFIASDPIPASALPGNASDSTKPVGVFHVSASSSSVLCGPNSPQKFQDYLVHDRPQLHLTVVSFLDATIVTLTWPHTLTDIAGIAAIIRCWCYILNESDKLQTDSEILDALPLVVDPFFDPVAGLGKDQPVRVEPFILSEYRITSWRLIKTIAIGLWQTLWERFVSGPSTSLGVIVIPQDVVLDLKREVLRSLESGGPGHEATPFLSDGDILTTWLTRMSLNGTPQTNRRPSQKVTVVNACDLRGRISSLCTNFSLPRRVPNPSEKVWIGNGGSVFSLFHIVSYEIAASIPLGYLATRIRAGIQAQVQESHIQAFFRDVRDSAQSIGGPFYFYMAPQSSLVLHSDWSRSRLLLVTDFAGAIIQCPTASSSFSEASKTSGRPVASYTERLGIERAGVINAFITTGLDTKGNYWITGRTTPASWRCIEQQLAARIMQLAS